MRLWVILNVRVALDGFGHDGTQRVYEYHMYEFTIGTTLVLSPRGDWSGRSLRQLHS